MDDIKLRVGLMKIGDLISEAVRLDKDVKEIKRKLDIVKAEIQSRGLRDIDDRNSRWVKYHSPDGSASVADTQSLDVLNVEKLAFWLGSGVWEQNVSVTKETKYKYKPKLEQALKAIFTEDYTFEYTLAEFVEQNLHPDPGQEKLLLRKLKGDYEKDHALLVSTLGHMPGGYDMECWYIHRIRNAELIKAFLPEEDIDTTIAEIRKCIMVDTKTGITLEYDKEDK